MGVPTRILLFIISRWRFFLIAPLLAFMLGGALLTPKEETRPLLADRQASLGQIGAKLPYSRSLFGSGWADRDGDCLDTRQEVLARDSEDERIKGCRVVSGTWYDPYTNQVLTAPKQADIDHLVSLHESFDSGASSWPKRKKIEFANDEDNLLAVYASENRRKGDKGLDEYLPPNREYQCEYAMKYLEVKNKWELRVEPAELMVKQKVCR